MQKKKEKKIELFSTHITPLVFVVVGVKDVDL